MQTITSSRPGAPFAHPAADWRPAWHSHPNGRTVAARDGAWLVQRRGGPVQVIGPGDRVRFGPGEEHWHVVVPAAP